MSEVPDNSTSPAAEEVRSQPGRSRQKWFHFRWRVLLVIPLAVLVLLAVYGPRQSAQRRALTTLRRMDAAVRTEPLPVPGAERLFGKDYSQTILEVYLRNPQINNEDLGVLAKVKSLQKLELAGSGVTSEGLLRLKGLPNLYTLHLAHTQITDEGLSILPTLPSLGILSLDETKITDDGLAFVGKAKSLERLFLNGTAITDAGLANLADLQNLKELACVNTAVTDSGLKHLKMLTSLEVLKIYNTKVTPEGLRDLQASLPKCVIWEPDADQ